MRFLFAKQQLAQNAAELAVAEIGQQQAIAKLREADARVESIKEKRRQLQFEYRFDEQEQEQEQEEDQRPKPSRSRQRQERLEQEQKQLEQEEWQSTNVSDDEFVNGHPVVATDDMDRSCSPHMIFRC
jgi:hypothetical protein